MSKVFLKSNQVSLVNGGYLSNGDVPVYNSNFVSAQRHAEYVITFAKLAEGKDFVGKKLDSLVDLEAEVKKLLSNKPTIFLEKKENVKGSLTNQLKEEAMSFMSIQSDNSKVDKINSFLQQFVVLQEFEDFGLFFEEEIVKLNRIYTLKEVVDAVTTTIDLLG